MTSAQRQRLFDVLMEHAPAEPDVRKELEEVTTFHLDAMEPLIDEMLLDAFNAGKRFADRKTADDIANPREVVIAL